MARSSIGAAGTLALDVATVLTVLTVLAVLGWLLWPEGSAADYRLARATVVQSGACGPSAGRDVVRLELDGTAMRAELDGCGYRRGETLTVEVPQAAGPEGLVVRVAGTGVPAGSTIGQRLSAVGAVLAGAAGAGLVWRLYRRHARE